MARYSSTLDARLTPEQRQAVDWYALQADCTPAQVARFFLPRWKPDLSNEDEAAEAHDFIDRLKDFRDWELEKGARVR